MGEVRTTSATGGQKGVKPERFSLLPVKGLAAISRVFGFGATKYAAENWRRGYEWTKSLDALQRHIQAFIDGETYDPESGEPHLGHAGFHILVLLTWLEEQGEGVDNPFDDRWPAVVERMRREAEPAEPKTYGEALDLAIAEWRSEVDTGDYDTEAWAIQAAAEDVRCYGRDGAYPFEGMSPEAYAEREAAKLKRALERDRLSKLASDGLAEACLDDDEVLHTSYVVRDSVLVEPDPEPEPDLAADVVEGEQASDEVRELEPEPVSFARQWQELREAWGQVIGPIWDRVAIFGADAAAEEAGFKIPDSAATWSTIGWRDPEPISFETTEMSLETIALLSGLDIEELKRPVVPLPEPPFGSGEVLVPEAARFGYFDDLTDLKPYIDEVQASIRRVVALADEAALDAYIAQSGAWVARFVVHADGTIERVRSHVDMPEVDLGL
jgi:hypothetical protein